MKLEGKILVVSACFMLICGLDSPSVDAAPTTKTWVRWAASCSIAAEDSSSGKVQGGVAPSAGDEVLGFGPHGSRIEAFCHIELPDDATIKKVGMFGLDDDSNGAWTVQIVKFSSTGGTTHIATATSTNSATTKSWFSSTVTEAVDNSSNGYFVHIHVLDSSPSTIADFFLSYVMVEYEI